MGSLFLENATQSNLKHKAQLGFVRVTERFKNKQLTGVCSPSTLIRIQTTFES